MQKLATAVERLPPPVIRKFAAIRGIVRRRRPDIIHFHGYCGGNAPDMGLHVALAMFPDDETHTAVTTHTSIRMLRAMSSTTLADIYYRSVRKLVESGFDGVLGFSQYDRGIYSRARMFFEVGVGVSLQDFVECDHQSIFERMGIPRNNKIVLYVGRLEPNKGVHHLVRAFSEVQKKSPDTSLVVAGTLTSTFRATLEKARAGVPGVYFPGFLSGHDKVCAFRNADLFCLPSYHEMFPITVLEAWAARIPVIVGNTGGSPLMVEPGTDGLHVRFGDVSDLADKMSLLLADEQVRAQMGRAGRKKVSERYTWSTVTTRVEHAYAQLIEAQ